MKSIFFLALLALVQIPLNSFAAKMFPNSLGDKDFFVTQLKFPKAAKALAAESCRENIARTVCLVDPIPDHENLGARICLEGGQAYAKYFENLYDRYPPALQKMFCSLRHIYIEKKMAGTAYAGLNRDTNGNPDGALMGVRKSVLDEELDLNTWATWKEQLSFGGGNSYRNPLPTLPTITSFNSAGTSDFLYFVITHEFGHIFDFANNLNQTQNCTTPVDKTQQPECEMVPGSWGSISWATSQKAKPENEFPLRKYLCFYWCNGQTIAHNDVLNVYSGLADTDFISLYATSQAWDDFADSLAYYLSYKNLGASYSIDTKQGPSYDIMEKLHAPIFAKKREYIERFLERSDIVYP
ncbi:MAG: hypothetical protein AB7K68_04045 [Bacteriovoracia bacterium]